MNPIFDKCPTLKPDVLRRRSRRPSTKLVFDKDPTAVCARGQKVRKFEEPPTTDGRVQILFTARLNSKERRNYTRKIAKA